MIRRVEGGAPHRGRRLTFGQQRRLALWHYCSAWHAGQGTREYSILSRLDGPGRANDSLSALARAENSEARQIYIRLASANLDRLAERRGAPRGLTSGYATCVCCSHAIVVDDPGAESGVTLCDSCSAHECDPEGPCECDDDDDDDGDDDDDES